MESTIIKSASFHLTDKAKDVIAFCICLVCLSLFLSTAYFKLVEHARFSGGLSRIAIIGRYAPFLSWVVPISEILISVLLIVPKTMKAGLYSFTGLMIVFTIYIVTMLLFASHMPCHCGGAIEKLSWPQHIWFNLGFILLAVFAIRLNNTKKTNL
jgi:hypothetical protein